MTTFSMTTNPAYLSLLKSHWHNCSMPCHFLMRSASYRPILLTIVYTHAYHKEKNEAHCLASCQFLFSFWQSVDLCISILNHSHYIHSNSNTFSYCSNMRDPFHHLLSLPINRHRHPPRHSSKWMYSKFTLSLAWPQGIRLPILDLIIYQCTRIEFVCIGLIFGKNLTSTRRGWMRVCHVCTH